MKRIKTVQRCSLNPCSLDDLTMIRMNAASISAFDPHDSIKIWIHEKKRRVANVEAGQESDASE